MHKTDKTGNKRIWLFVALGVLLLLSVFRALGSVTEALALEQQPRCGMTEHLHTESCYINDVLVCRQKAHTHSDSCYPLLLADNDINQLLTQIASTRDRSLESLLRSGNVRGILVLNKDLRVQTTQEDNAEVDSPWIGGVGLLAVNDTPSTASNAINFYIRLDGNITCIGSKTLTTSRNIRQLSKTNAVSAYTAVVETSLTTGNLQSSYYLRYNTTGSTTSFSSTAGASGSNLTFGNGSSALRAAHLPFRQYLHPHRLLYPDAGLLRRRRRQQLLLRGIRPWLYAAHSERLSLGGRRRQYRHHSHHHASHHGIRKTRRLHRDLLRGRHGIRPRREPAP